MMDDDFIIETIARRLDDEVPWTKGATIFKHQDWVDVVTHLWSDKKLRSCLIEAYASEIEQAKDEREEQRSRDSAYAEWRADSSLRASESDSVPW